MAALLDTGVLLRLFNRSDPQSSEIRGAIRALCGARVDLVCTAQNIAEFWNVCTRPATARGGFGLSPADAARKVRGLERLITVLDDSPLAYTVWKDLATKHELIGVSVHDARIVALMLVWGIADLLTLNPGDFRRYSGINVTTPRDVLSRRPDVRLPEAGM
jgi:predicted nucleic acid-binding protein